MTIIEQGTLHEIEAADLVRYETVIERGLTTFYDVGEALLAIRDQRLYRAEHPTFEAYCRERWGIARQRAYELIDAAEIFNDLSGIADKPTRQSHAAPLAAVPPAERAEVWQEAVATAPNGKVTAAHVADVVQRHIAPPALDDEPLDAYEEAIAAQHQAKQAEPDPEPPPATENHQRINLSTNNEWYTPGVFLEAVRQVLGQIDLDPASCAFANQVVQATRYYTQEDDGLHQPWFGKVWMNPPYGREEGERDSNQARWTRRLLDAYHAGDVTEAIMLVNAVPGNRWFVPLKDYPICFPDGRIRFYNEATEAGQPTHSNAFVYLGPNIATFDRVFSSFGAVMCRASVWAAWQQEQANA